MESADRILQVVNQKYAAAAEAPEACLCGPTTYDRADLASFIPQEVLDVSYGCGTPVGLSTLRDGEIVLDIGSGGGIDCFLALRKVGPAGKVYGLDMTDQMLEIARRNAPKVAAALGHPEVRTEFLKGVAGDIPLPESSLDLIISNCVINLAPDKDAVFREMFRTLRPGGRFTVSDIVSDQEVPRYMSLDPGKWGECLSGALLARDYLGAVRAAGFPHVELTASSPWRLLDGINFFSVTLTAYKPVAGVVLDGFATYLGPFRSARLPDGTEVTRGVPRKIEGALAGLLVEPRAREEFILEPAPRPLEAADPRWLVSSRGSGACQWRGDYALYVGPFDEVVDDDGHRFSRGLPLEICSATDTYLRTTPAVGRHFARVNRCSTSPEIAAAACTTTTCC